MIFESNRNITHNCLEHEFLFTNLNKIIKQSSFSPSSIILNQSSLISIEKIPNLTEISFSFWLEKNNLFFSDENIPFSQSKSLNVKFKLLSLENEKGGFIFRIFLCQGNLIIIEQINNNNNEEIFLSFSCKKLQKCSKNEENWVNLFFVIFQGKICIYLNGLLIEEKNIANLDNFKKISLGNNLENSKENSNNYLKIGPILIFKKKLSPLEINSLYLITNSQGLINFFVHKHSLNFNLISFENVNNPFYNFNLANINISQGKNNNFQNNFLFIKPFIEFDFSYLINFIIAEINPELCFASKENYNNLIFLNKFSRKIHPNFKINSFFNNGKLSICRETFLEILENNDIFCETLLNILEKTKNKKFFLNILTLLSNILNFSVKLLENFEKKELGKILCKILRNKENFFNLKEIFDTLFNFLLVNFKGENPSTFLIAPKTFSSLFVKNYEVYGILKMKTKKYLLSKIIKIIDTRNIFLIFNIELLRRMELVKTLIFSLMNEHFSNIETVVFDIIFNIIRPYNSLKFDKNGFKYFKSFIYSTMSSTNKKFPLWKMTRNILLFMNRKMKYFI